MSSAEFEQGKRDFMDFLKLFLMSQKSLLDNYLAVFEIQCFGIFSPVFGMKFSKSTIPIAIRLVYSDGAATNA